ncbi:MAG TPA: squalene synthase HpnC [Jatrophihabitans sp.]|nr:squalene synthase HpnC [Jatrophihabitans sp.]
MTSTPASESIATLNQQRRAENFPVSLRVLPRTLRQDLIAVYDVVRVIDNLGDEATGDRLALLDSFAADQHRAFTAGRPQADVLRRLVPAIRRRELSEQPLLDLIEANRTDQRTFRYETFEDLLGYCRLSAVPIGRLVLQIFGYRQPELAVLSDDVCIALQILEHCQDVAEDYRRGRIYLPQQDLRHFGVTEAELTGSTAGPGLRALIELEVDRCERLLDAGDELVGRLRGWARPAIAGYLAGGRATVTAIRQAGGDVLATVPKPSRLTTARYALRILSRRRDRHVR